jgi:hypothetical protein
MIKYRKLFFIIFITITPAVFSQGPLLPDEEAPKTIFTAKIGEEDLDLYLLGSWETTLQGGAGFFWNSEDTTKKESSFPAMSSGFQLSHAPDIFISLWFMNSYYFESSFIDNYELNTILFGYESIEDNFLQSVRIGNTDIGFGDYSFLNIPEASTDSMGGMALFNSDRSEHQLMLRYDPAEIQVKYYKGPFEVDPSITELTDYIKGRYFILPDDNVENLRVYIEENGGTFSGTAAYGTSSYRLADSSDAIISAEEGIVFFRDTLNSRAAVYYTKNGNPVGNSLLGTGALAAEVSGEIDITSTPIDFNFSLTYLGQNMGDRSLSGIETDQSLILHEPGVFSPFELLSIYSLPYLLPENPALFYAILADINLNTGEKLNIEYDFEDYMVRVLFSDNSYRDPANRYPLADSISSDSLIYGPAEDLSGAPIDKELLFERLFSVDNYNLGDNVLEGSLSVKINGFDEFKYTFNPESGTVDFLFPVPSDALIEISYRTMTTAGKTGDLLIALGSSFNFSDNFLMETGAGLRWNILDSNFIEKPGDASGSIIGTAGLSYSTENFNFNIDVGLSVHSPNTTGILRLAGMNQGGFDVPVSGNLLYPASTPPSGGTIDADLSYTPDSSNRGELLFKDFYKYDASGTSSLQNYDWLSPISYPYDTDGRTGPYITGTNSEIKGNSAVLDYSLGDNEWTGGRIPLILGTAAMDLSNIQSISLKWKHIPITSGNIKMYISLGSLEEDLDGDSYLDKETSVYDSGFTFNDKTFEIQIGLAYDGKGGNNQLDTEDLNGNGLLDREGPKKTMNTGEVLNLSTDWATLTIDLTPSDRERLRASNAFEIILAGDGVSSGGSGRLLIGDIIFRGSSFVTKPAGSQIMSTKEVNELYSSSPTPLLIESYPEVSVFSSGSELQNVTEINWDIADFSPWEITTFTEAVDLSDYNKISFYLKTPVLSEAPTDITFSLTNPSGKGVSLSYPPISSTNWVKYTIDYKTGVLSADGVNISGVIWKQRDYNSSKQNRLSLSAICSGGGSLLFDEVHLEDPVVGVSGAASSNFNFKYPGNILSYNEKPILSNFAFSNSSSIKGSDFASGFSKSRDSIIYTASDLDISLLNTRMSGNLNLQWLNTELYTSPGISFTIPLFNNSIIIKDHYSEINFPLTSSTLKESSVITKLGRSSLILSAISSHSLQSLIRNWGISSNTVWGKGSSLDSTADFRMVSIENPYNNMNLLDKFFYSYYLYLPGNSKNDRTSTISIKPAFNFNNIIIGINETLISSNSGISERDLNSSQLISMDGKFTFNSKFFNEWYLIPEYKKPISITDTTTNNNNFLTDTGESIQNIGSQLYYFSGFPIWEILFPDSGVQFTNSTANRKNAEYSPEFSLEFLKTSGSDTLDIFIPSSVNFILSRTLNRDFDSVTDSLAVNLKTKATALNIFGKLGTTPIFTWYQTEEITSVFAITGEYRSYMSEIFKDPLFTMNYSLYLNFSLDKVSSLSFETNHSLVWLPVNWYSSTSASYKWVYTPEKVLNIPLLGEEENSSFEHNEKITLSTDLKTNQNEFIYTVTADHITKLILSDKGNISAFAGLGWNQKNIVGNEKTTNYYQIGFEAGISVKLTY